MPADGPAWEATPLPLAAADLVLDLERLAYPGSDVGDRRYYDWLYRTNPAGEGIVWYAATTAADVPSAGHYAVVPVRLALGGGEDVTGSLSLNTLTHPGYRRQGVFVTLAERVFAECAQRGIACTYGFPNPSSYPGFVGPLRFADIGRLTLLVAPLAARGLVPSEAAPPVRALVRIGAVVAVPVSALARRRLEGDGVAVREVTADGEVWDALWARLRGRYPVMVVRDRRWIAWRFGGCPTRRYRLYLADKDGGPLGFAATRIGTILGLRAGLVVDLLGVPGPHGRAAGHALLRAALAEFAAAGVALAAALVPRHAEEYGWLRAAGFFPCPGWLEPQPFPVILRAHGPATVPAALPSWLLTMGDYDAV